MFLHSKLTILINAWLKSGMANKKVCRLKKIYLFPKYIVYSILINLILNGLEEVIKYYRNILIKSKRVKTTIELRYWSKINITFDVTYVRYVSSFVLLLESKYVIYSYIIFFIINYLKVRGLKLNKKKTKLLKLKNKSIKLNFLSYTWKIKPMRYYSASTIFKRIFSCSGKQKVFNLIVKIKAIFKKLNNWGVYFFISELSLILKSWFNYYYLCVNFFYYKNIIKFAIYRLIWKWASQKHMLWGKKAIAAVYFLTIKTSIPFFKRKSYIKFKSAKWVLKKTIKHKGKKKTNYLHVISILQLISSKYVIFPKSLLAIHGYSYDYIKLIAFNTNFVFN